MLNVKQVRAIMKKHGRDNKGYLCDIFVNKTVDETVRTVKCYYTGDDASVQLLSELRDAGADVRLLEREGSVGTISVRATK